MKPLFWRKVLSGVVTAAVCSAILLCIFAFAGLADDDPAALAPLLSKVALIIGAFIGGRVASVNAENRALRGVVCGVCYMFLILVPSLILSSWGASSMLWALLTVLASVFGAVVARGNTSGGRSGIKKRRNISKKYSSYLNV